MVHCITANDANRVYPVHVQIQRMVHCITANDANRVYPVHVQIQRMVHCITANDANRVYSDPSHQDQELKSNPGPLATENW